MKIGNTIQFDIDPGEEKSLEDSVLKIEKVRDCYEEKMDGNRYSVVYFYSD